MLEPADPIAGVGEAFCCNGEIDDAGLRRHFCWKEAVDDEAESKTPAAVRVGGRDARDFGDLVGRIFFFLSCVFGCEMWGTKHS